MTKILSSTPSISSKNKKGISLPLIKTLSPETETPKTDGNTGVMENTTGATDEPKKEIPVSNRMDELMVVQMEPETRTSGAHPKIKKHPKWMIGPKFNGRERWMDLTKITGWNLDQKQVILSRSEIQHRGYEGFIKEPFNPETHKDFTLLKNL